MLLADVKAYGDDAKKKKLTSASVIDVVGVNALCPDQELPAAEGKIADVPYVCDLPLLRSTVRLRQRLAPGWFAESSNISLALAVGLALFCLIVGCWIICLLLQPAASPRKKRD